MNIGYACLAFGVLGTKLRTCTMKNAAPDVLRKLIQSNLDALNKILDYNIQNDIRLFRISSDIIPFGSHAVNTLRWWEEFNDQLKDIGHKALVNGMRLSMHPGQYTVLNSPDEAVVMRAVEDLWYHGRFLDVMGLGTEHKIILHIGGIYGDKTAATQRFIQQYRYLDENIHSRLVIENDDRLYTISDVLSIGERDGFPVVFDNLHHQVNSDNTRSEKEWIVACSNTWKAKDGPQKLHYSQPDTRKRPGSHSVTLDVDEFLQFYALLPKQGIDIMVEVKDKNLSALKCINAIVSPKIQRLEKEWGRYKYLVLEHSPEIFNDIGQLLKDTKTYPLSAFYRLIDESMKTSVTAANAINAAQHVWKVVKDLADEQTRLNFENKLLKVSQGGASTAMKRQLWNLKEVQQQRCLLDSLYFMELYE